MQERVEFGLRYQTALECGDDVLVAQTCEGRSRPIEATLPRREKLMIDQQSENQP